MHQVLESERLRLRPWTEQDVGLLTALSSIPAVTRYVGDGNTWTSLKATTVSDRALAHWEEQGFGWRVMVHRDTGDEIGLVSHNRMGEGTAGLEPDEHEIGWWLSPQQWGHGYAREAARAVAQHALDADSAPHLSARIRPENTGSIAVATSIGMAFEFNTVAQPGILVAVYRVWASRPGARASNAGAPASHPGG